MSAPKPSGLIRRAETLAKKAERQEKEQALRPESALPLHSPARLKGHPGAQKVWRDLVGLYDQLAVELASRLDEGLLADYCLACEELTEISEMRRTALDACRSLTDCLADLPQDVSLEDRLALAARLSAAQKDVLAIDARTDRKKTLIHDLRRSLYLTPRSRAGAAPAVKKEEPYDEFEAFLNDTIPPV